MAKEYVTDDEQLRTLAQKPGAYPVARNLVLRVSPTLARSWIYRYKHADGSQPEPVIGRYPATTIKAAIAEAERLTTQREAGVDLKEARADAKTEIRSAAKPARSFRVFALETIAERRAAWSSPGSDWTGSFNLHVFPYIGDIPIRDITVAHVAGVLSRIKESAPDVAARLRGWIAKVMARAKALDEHPGPNPANAEDMNATLQWDLPTLRRKKRDRQGRTENHAALPYGELPAFMADIVAADTDGSRALAFDILTMSRPGEVRKATVDQFDLTAKVWNVPPMSLKKRNKNHVVPLSDAAIALLNKQDIETLPKGAFVFPGKTKPNMARQPRANAPMLSNGAMKAVIRRMGRNDITVHGTARSTSADYLAEHGYPAWVIDLQLAHKVPGAAKRGENREPFADAAISARYRRTPMLTMRIQMMNAWGAYCMSEYDSDAGSNVQPIRPAARSAA